MKKDEPCLDDNDIADRVSKGQRELYRFLVDKHKKNVHALGMSFMHNHDDAADFTQEVFLKAFHSIGQFKGTARFSTWLYRIAYNTAINSVNRKKEYLSLSDEGNEAQSTILTPEEESIRNAVCAAVRQAVQELPEKYRVCIDLFFFYDRSYEEIEVITGDPLGTIKSHVFRAKNILREKLHNLR
jgi:RNA polymerase sigma-70 factor (ECF subfamily)